MLLLSISLWPWILCTLRDVLSVPGCLLRAELHNQCIDRKWSSTLLVSGKLLLSPDTESFITTPGPFKPLPYLTGIWFWLLSVGGDDVWIYSSITSYHISYSFYFGANTIRVALSIRRAYLWNISFPVRRTGSKWGEEFTDTDGISDICHSAVSSELIFLYVNLK